MPVRIVLLGDIHYGDMGSNASCHAEFGDILLLRAVKRINRLIRPDIVLIAGDLLDAGDTTAATERLQRLRQIIDQLQMPVLIIPGNHDSDSAAFYSIMPRPPDQLDIGPVRFVSCVDPEAPGYNAYRTGAELQRLRTIRAQHQGPLVVLQHVPVFPPDQADCPYGYTNAAEVLAAMRGPGLTLALAGHYHNSLPLLRDGNLAFAAAPALGAVPFRFLELTIQADGQVSAEVQALAMPAVAKLRDVHVHTPYAYCNENMQMHSAATLGELFGLQDVTLAEHSAHLYFDRATYGQGAYLRPESAVKPAPNAARMLAYLREASAAAGPRLRVGMEADLDFAGSPIVLPEHRNQVYPLLGAMHTLPELCQAQPDLQRAVAQYLQILTRAAGDGIQILAHPFRVFRRARQPIPEQLFAPTVQLLRTHGVAAEINFHTNEPPLEFFRLCIAAGVKICFGSDAHNLYEVGEFAPHLHFLSQLGIAADAPELFWQP